MKHLIDRRAFIAAGSASAGLLVLPQALWAKPGAGFTHGVASGEPGPDRMMLWTRYVGQDAQTRLRAEVAEDSGFTRIVTKGEATASILTDHSAKVVATGLQPGRPYFYRFVSPAGQVSPVGRTRTLPEGPADRFRIAVFSCSNATSGWFNAYAHAAARDDIDLVLHLGDYIYESPIDRPDAIEALTRLRAVAPPHETLSLLDYRLRYASYRADPDLTALHQAFPMIAIPDDHESANNSWMGGASGHGPEDGDWNVRKTAAMRAWHEWLPVGPEPYARHDIGTLASIFRIETRLVGRTKQLGIADYLGGATGPAAAARDFMAGPLADPARTMMGKAQEEWLYDGFRRSVAQGVRWQVLAQQVIMGAEIVPPDAASWFRDPSSTSEKQRADLDLAVAAGKMGLTLRFDRWDGYPAARARLLRNARDADANLVVLSGDSHNGWAYDLRQDEKPAGVEFAGQSVSSFGMERRFDGDPARIAADMIRANPALRWCDTSRRGYMVVDISRDAITTEWLFLPSGEIRGTEVQGRKAATVEYRSRHLSL